jgi:hypothetical protein
MWGTLIQAFLSFIGYGAKAVATNQEIINSPEVRKGVEARQDVRELDQIHTDTQTGNTKGAEDDFSR